MIRRWLALLCLLAAPAWAQPEQPVQPPVELQLASEHPVQGMANGNLSGLAWCGDAFWAVSDRDDNLLYRLDASQPVWQAQAEQFQLPEVPYTGLSWGTRARAAVTGSLRGGQMDFEGLTCDSLGNRYLASEAHAAVLRVDPAGSAEWLQLPQALVRQARASGMLLQFNAMFEGLAVDPQAERLWLAAERQRRGLLVLHRKQSRWQCTGGCVLLAEGGIVQPPAALSDEPLPRSFSGLAFFEGKLFSLEPASYQVCRRNPANGSAERCWSFAEAALAEPRRYPTRFGTAEALWVDGEGAWIGVDNNQMRRADGEDRPVVWRFAAPKGGWGAKP